MDEYPVDECNVYVSMEHADGCIFWDMRPPLKVLGVLMIASGAMLMVFGMTVSKMFMKFLVRIGIFIVMIAIFWKMQMFDTIDPTALSKRNAAEGYVLVGFAVIIALVAAFVGGFLFRKSLRFGPTLIGALTGWWFSIYFIISANSFIAMFTVSGAADFISPVWATVIEVMGFILGGAIGNCYSYIFIMAIQTCISAYLVMRGFTLILNFGYPNEFIIINAANSETNSLLHLGFAFWFYMIWFFGMWIWAFKV